MRSWNGTWRNTYHIRPATKCQLDDRHHDLLHRHSPFARTLARATSIDCCFLGHPQQQCAGEGKWIHLQPGQAHRPNRCATFGRVDREVDQTADRCDRRDRYRQLAVADPRDRRRCAGAPRSAPRCAAPRPPGPTAAVVGARPTTDRGPRTTPRTKCTRSSPAMPGPSRSARSRHLVVADPARPTEADQRVADQAKACQQPVRAQLTAVVDDPLVTPVRQHGLGSLRSARRLTGRVLVANGGPTPDPDRHSAAATDHVSATSAGVRNFE